MNDTTRPRLVARLYVATVIAAGVVTVATSSAELIRTPPPKQWFVLAILTLFTGSASIKVPSLSARISVSEAFVIAAVLAFGPSVATIIVALDALIVTLWLRRDSRSPLRALFNISAGASAIWIGGHLFELLLARISGPTRLEAYLLPTAILALSYFAINSWLIAIALSLERRTPVIALWRGNFLWLALNYFGGASVALLVVTNSREVDTVALSVIVPLLIITYLTLRTSLGRLEDANHHVDQLNELYLSTIEALAMAVDAKDQITHGHIRRVQVYAVELAKKLGVRDHSQVRAIEAAALLHDMGKLAIPEHILNKPGKLTPAEFDKMKRHADIGADLLSSIKFPYPVVPIVRHHHENWNGRGYPAGISGTDIPLGARILAVVDCFDALTSDRPYRPRLTTDEAFDIIRQRSGTVYDPLVVDSFIASYGEIAPRAIRAGKEARSILVSTDSGDATGDELALHQIRANASETVVLKECAQRIARSSSASEAIDIAAQAIRQLTPATTCAVYRYDASSDVLVCDAATGDPQKLLLGLTLRLGERVTGWSGANYRTSMNSDATLDLSHIAGLFTPPLKSTIALPLMQSNRLVGVLTGYSSRQDAFDEMHRYAMEQIGGLLAERLMPHSASSGTVVSFRTPKHS